MKKLTILLSLCLSVFWSQLQAQGLSPWTKTGQFSLQLTQTSFSNWAAGGNSSVGFEVQGNYQADYKQDKTLWRNRVELAYGFNNIKGDRSRKTNDKLFLNSQYGYEIHKCLYAGASLDYRTQFANGFNYDTDPISLTSQFMAPGYLSVGAGIIWTPKPYFTLTFNPVAYRGIFVFNSELSDLGAFGVDPGDRYKTQLGANLQADFNYWLMTNVNLYTRLDLYSNYLDKPQNVDINWEVMLMLVVNEWISVNLTTNLLYDDDVIILTDSGERTKKVQFKELLSVGLMYTF